MGPPIDPRRFVLRDEALWYPDIPDRDLGFVDSMHMPALVDWEATPVLALVFGGARGQLLPNLTRVDICSSQRNDIYCIEFWYKDDRGRISSRILGSDVPPDPELGSSRHSLDLEEHQGEYIEYVGVSHWGEYILSPTSCRSVGIRVCLPA